MPIEKFFVTPAQDPTRENILLPNEILTEIDVPNAPAGSKAIYVKEMVREVWDFALCSVAAMVTVRRTASSRTRASCSAAWRRFPYRALKAEAAITGKRARRGHRRRGGRRRGRRRAAAGEERLQGSADTGVVERALLSLA